MSEICKEAQKAKDDEFALRRCSSPSDSRYNGVLSIEVYCRDCSVNESTLTQLLKGAPSQTTNLGPIRELQARISFATISKLISQMGGSISWKIDVKILTFAIKHPLKLLDPSLKLKEDNAEHEFQQAVRVLDSKLADIRDKESTLPRRKSSRKARYTKTSASASRSFEEKFAFNVFNDGGGRSTPNIDSPAFGGSNPFDDSFDARSALQEKGILYIGNYIANPSVKMTQAISIDAAQDILDINENIWSAVIIQVVLTTIELREFIAFMRSRKITAHIVGNRDCPRSQVRFYSDVVRFPLEKEKLEALTRELSVESHVCPSILSINL
jgi:hypothetical protein